MWNAKIQKESCPSESKLGFATLFSGTVTGDNFVGLNTDCPMVATVVAFAQLWSDCGNRCRVCPALIRLWQQLSRVPSSEQMYFSLQHFIVEGIKAGDFIHVLGQKCVCIIANYRKAKQNCTLSKSRRPCIYYIMQAKTVQKYQPQHSADSKSSLTFIPRHWI